MRSRTCGRFAARAPAPPAPARVPRSPRRAAHPRAEGAAGAARAARRRSRRAGRRARGRTVRRSPATRRTASWQRTEPFSFSLSRLAPIVRQASRFDSTNVALAAPRLSASSPIAPEPAKRSSTSASSTGPIRLNAFSRTRSEVGRVVAPRGRGDPMPAVAAGDDPHLDGMVPGTAVPGTGLRHSAAADRGDHVHARRGCERRVECRPLPVDVEVDVRPDRRPRLAEAVA